MNFCGGSGKQYLLDLLLAIILTFLPPILEIHEEQANIVFLPKMSDLGNLIFFFIFWHFSFKQERNASKNPEALDILQTEDRVTHAAQLSQLAVLRA